MTLNTLIFISTAIIAFSSVGIYQLQNLYTKSHPISTNDQKNSLLEEQKNRTVLNFKKELPSFGLSNLYADWEYLQFIQYFGDTTLRSKIGYSLIPDYFELMTNYDPRFLRAYFTLSSANSIYAGRADKTVELINKILPYISPKLDPLAYNLWIYKGVDEIIFLGDIPSARHSYEMSAKWALELKDKKLGREIAERSLRTAQFLAKNPDSQEARVSAWAHVLSSAFDEATRQLAINNIEKLGGTIEIYDNGSFKVNLPKKD